MLPSDFKAIRIYAKFARMTIEKFIAAQWLLLHNRDKVKRCLICSTCMPGADIYADVCLPCKNAVGID